MHPKTLKHENICMVRDIMNERYIITYSDISESILITDILDRTVEDDTVAEPSQVVINYTSSTPSPSTVFLSKQLGLLDMKQEQLKLVCSFSNGQIITYDIATTKVLQRCKPLYHSLVQGQLMSANISIDDYCTMVCYMGSN